MLAQLTKAAVGSGVAFYVIQMITLVLLVLAANTSFGGLPVLASLLAEDNFLPHVFHLKGERQVYRYGVGVLAVSAAALLIVSRGDTQALIPLFAIGVFVGFTLSQVGMVRHWRAERGPGWEYRAADQRARRGAHLPGHHHRAGQQVHRGRLGGRPGHPVAHRAFHRRPPRLRPDRRAARASGRCRRPRTGRSRWSWCPMLGLSRLTEEAISAALSLSDQVTAVNIVYDDPDDEDAEARFRRSWSEWGVEVPLVTLHSARRSLGTPIVEYLRKLEGEDSDRRLVVLIAEVEPMHPWEWILHNQRGLVLDRAIRRGTANVVICRIRFRDTIWS